jgi:hypothetical protein
MFNWNIDQHPPSAALTAATSSLTVTRASASLSNASHSEIGVRSSAMLTPRTSSSTETVPLASQSPAQLVVGGVGVGVGELVAVAVSGDGDAVGAVGVTDAATVRLGVLVASAGGELVVRVGLDVAGAVAVCVGEARLVAVREGEGVRVAVGVGAATSAPPRQNPPPTMNDVPLALPASGCPIVTPALNVPPIAAVAPPPSMVLRSMRYGPPAWPADWRPCAAMKQHASASLCSARLIDPVPAMPCCIPTLLSRREDRPNDVHRPRAAPALPI